MDKKAFIAKLPKVEIHIHLEAVSSLSTLVDLNRRYKLIPEISDSSSLKKYIFVNNLAEMITKFFSFQQLFRKAEDYQLLMRDVLEYTKNNNIQYMESFVSPSMVKRLGSVPVFDFYSILSEEIHKIKKDHDIDIKLIIDLSRSFGPENAQDNLTTVKEYLARHPDAPIIGFGLGGKEGGNPAKLYKKVFDEAKETGLHLVAHAGEEVDSQSIREAIEDLSAERIGHGTSAIYDKDMRQLLKERAIPLEVCVTSNLATKKYVKKYENHPIKEFFQEGLLVTVNTDDPILFDVDLNKEILLLHTQCGMDMGDVMKILKYNVDCSFMKPSQKKEFWNKRLAPLIKEAGLL